MQVQMLVNILLEAGENGHSLFPPEMLCDTIATVDVDMMGDMADAALEHHILLLTPSSKKYPQKEEMIKLLYHLRGDVEFRAEVARVMIREYRKEMEPDAVLEEMEME